MKKVLFVSSEALPFAATGGLGDVIGSLPFAMKNKRKIIDVRVVLPLYKRIADTYREKMTFICEFSVNLAWRKLYCGIFSYVLNGITFYFVDNEYYFKREGLYGDFDDGEKYAFFCRAVMDMLPKVDYIPDILHCHDWQSALCVIYLKRKYCFFAEYSKIKAVYTIHNIGYQGIFNMDILYDVFDLDAWDKGVVEYDGCINLTKGAIVTCDKLTTVSPTYSKEISDEYYSNGLHHIIRMYESKITGIVNGIDTNYYNPETDVDIDYTFSSSNIEKKAENKVELQKFLGLTQNKDIMLLAVVSRLASHKGFDLVMRVAEEIMELDIQLVILGTGEQMFETFFSELAKRYPDKCAVKLLFDKSLSKKIYASADAFLMPSKSEPCGLSQMIASRYGTIPIVRETGGLYDTIKPYNIETGEGNGITFKTYNAHDMLDAVSRAKNLYYNKKCWNELSKKAMEIDFSWATSAKEYLLMYEKL